MEGLGRVVREARVRSGHSTGAGESPLRGVKEGQSGTPSLLAATVYQSGICSLSYRLLGYGVKKRNNQETPTRYEKPPQP